MIKRIFSTREVAQMWNVSESTIKRWADSHELDCYRTPGGHRKFRLENISDFQRRRGFEATGLLTTEKWEEPEIEDSLNRKRFDKVCHLVFYLASQNQRKRVKDLLERLYIRGMSLVELYDDILMPVTKRSAEALTSGDLSLGQQKLLRNNLDDAVALLFPQLIRRRHRGKTALCAAPDNSCRIRLNAVAHILETEGWDCLNLGDCVPFEAVADMVEQEPVNLVCLVSDNSSPPSPQRFSEITEAADGYRIPVVLAGAGFSEEQIRERFPHQEYFDDFRSFLGYLNRLAS